MHIEPGVTNYIIQFLPFPLGLGLYLAGRLLTAYLIQRGQLPKWACQLVGSLLPIAVFAAAMSISIWLKAR